MENFKTFESLIYKNKIRFIDLRFTDILGKEHHITIPSKLANQKFFVEGKMFDGSSIIGWKDINESDMLLIPDHNDIFIDPFFKIPTLVIRCDIVEPTTMQPYDRDPRAIAKKCEEYLQSTKIADLAFFGPEPEFFIFDCYL